MSGEASEAAAGDVDGRLVGGHAEEFVQLAGSECPAGVLVEGVHDDLSAVFASGGSGLVPGGTDELWELFQRVVPEAPTRPQGGGRRRHGDREVLAAIVFVATSGCTWQQLPSASFGPSGATAHRRFTEWSKARVWAKLHRLVLDELGARGQLDWSRPLELRRSAAVTCMFIDIEPHQRLGRRAVPASRDVATDGAATLLNDKPHNRGDLHAPRRSRASAS